MSGVPRRVPEAPAATAAPDRARRLRVARGVCWVIVGCVCGAAVLVTLDAAIRLPGWVRGLGLAVWATAVGVLVWRFVLVPWREEPGEAPGDSRRELSGNVNAAAAAALALVGCLLAGSFVPGTAEHFRRVALPWQRPASAPYRIVVTSGEPVVRRGGSVTLAAYIERADPAAPAVAAVFVFRDRAGGPEQRVPATGDGSGAFHVTRAAVPADFEYRVEAAGAVGDWLTVSALDPVELADDSAVELLPPKYAPAAPKRVATRPTVLEGFQHGTAEFRLRFTRPAADASLEFRADGGSLEITRIALAADRQTGTATFRLRQDGQLRLVMVAERGGKKLRTESPVAVRVRPDTAPRFTAVAGLSPRPVTARPTDTLRVELAATDDLAVGSAVLEWLGPGGSTPIAIPFTLSGAGTPTAHGQLALPLAGKGREGEMLRVRVRVLDSRRLDDPEVKPQEAVYPEGGWATVRLAADAPPLEPQEITGRHDAVRDSLTPAQTEVSATAEAAEKLRDDTEGKPDFAVDHVVRLNALRDTVRKAAGLLTDAAREAALNPELRSLAASIRTTADSLANTDEVLRGTATAPPPDRSLALTTAARHLAAAADRLTEFLARNERLARDRLDARELALLAADQAALAEKLATLPPAKTLESEKALLARFRALLAESTPLRDATEAARQTEFDRLAAAASDLAGAIRELDTAARDLHADTRGRLLANILANQKLLATRTAALLARIETAARLANVRLPNANDFRRIPEVLAAGKSLDALTEMEALARTLGGIAAGFEKVAADRADTKAAARQLALWQDDLRNRFRTLTGGKPASFGMLPAATRTAFLAEQAALHEAAAGLHVPVAGEEVRAARDSAIEHLTAAGRFLEGNGTNADVAMKNAADYLNRLADKLPTVAERLVRSRSGFDKFFREQESIQNEVEKAIRGTDAAILPRKLATFADRQRKQLAGVAALDLPGHDTRRVRFVAAVTAAADDLGNGLPLDVLASQGWAKREFDRLRVVLFDGATPPDQKADELARRLDLVVKAVEALGPTPTKGQLDTYSPTIQDVFRQLGPFPRSPEIAAILNDAQEAARLADSAFRDGSKPDELVRRLKFAADAVARLADRLNGAESDLDRIRRLAANRRAPVPSAPGEMARQLGREIEELTQTRVGAVGELRKKRVLAQYAALKDQGTPEAKLGAQAALAEALDELAALTADVEELTRTFDRNPPAGVPVAADDYLPSRLLADSLRELARQYRSARATITELPTGLETRLKPTDARPLIGLEARQRTLAADAATLAKRLATEADATIADTASELARLAATGTTRLRNGAVRAANETATRVVGLLRALAEAGAGKPWAATCTELASRQEAIAKEAAALLDSPGVAAARQQQQAAELSAELADLIQTLETAARDAGPDAGTGKALGDAAATATLAGKLLAEATQKAANAKVEDAAAVRGEAEAQLRAAAGKVAGAGPAPTMLPTLEPETAAVGEALRRAELATQQAIRSLDGKPDPATAGKAMRAATEFLNRAAKGTRDRLAAGER